ncbi:uncharacterized protein B0I36DRAFT_332347 [Microdochium trichocladiopsis]|uniref:Uncharacterized protein n=1 Tax=Microdochium trichocladiopsis TaxID=1682393 RepID=A0A9P8XY82_9PEZI|nr:uncharacterized protein B0I36DRAFT_332347 [Microdochium trichocladiopsis]KAH7024977.1 hypothetical protein B0I36DRAFT_332347 [Microdochium trichocladiopsis]
MRLLTNSNPGRRRHQRQRQPHNAIPFLTTALLATTTLAQVVQDTWTFPKGPDLATTINVGQKIRIGWTSSLQDWFPAYCPGCLKTAADLYITSVGISGQLPFKHKVASKIDVTSDFSIEWTVSLPDNEVSCQSCGSWAFRFMADDANGEVASNVFSVKPARPGSSSSDTTTATTLSTVASTTTVNTSTQQTGVPVAVPTQTAPGNAPVNSPSSPSNNNGDNSSSSNNDQAPSTGLSTGAKAGLGVGVALGAIVLVLMGWFLANWHKKRTAAKTDEDFLTTYLEVRQGRTSRTGASSPLSSGPPRHRPLSDFMLDKSAKEKWDPSETFASGATSPGVPPSATNASVRSHGSSAVPDFLGVAAPRTPDSPSFELLPRSGPRS